MFSTCRPKKVIGGHSEVGKIESVLRNTKVKVPKVNPPHDSTLFSTLWLSLSNQ